MAHKEEQGARVSNDLGNIETSSIRASRRRNRALWFYGFLASVSQRSKSMASAFPATSECYDEEEAADLQKGKEAAEGKTLARRWKGGRHRLRPLGYRRKKPIKPKGPVSSSAGSNAAGFNIT